MHLVSSFNIGLCFFYWKWFDPKSVDKEDVEPPSFMNHNDYSGYSRDDLFVANAKFRDLKEEAIESGLCSPAQFAAMVLKAEELMKSEKIKGLRARSYGHARYYGIVDGAEITVKHVQSVVLYTDFTKLCSVFSATFRPDHLGESLDSIKTRNASWFEMSKLLRETVECFGNRKKRAENPNGENGPFFCGVNRLMIVSSFGIRLCSPTSTSKARSVAIRFADTEGIVLRFNNEEGALKFFDCSAVSAFTEESERLFFGGDYRTRVESVMVMDGFKNYRKYFHIFYAFDLMLSGGKRRALKKEFTSNAAECLKWFIDGVVNGVKGRDRITDQYVIDTFNAYTQNKKSVVINLDLMHRDYPKGLYEQVVHSVVRGEFNYKWSEPEDISMNMVRWNRLFALFPSLETLIVYGRSALGTRQYPFSLIQSVLALHEVFARFQCINTVEIKGVHYRGNKSWIHDAFGALKVGLDLKTIGVSLTNGKDSFGKENDLVRIERKSV